MRNIFSLNGLLWFIGTCEVLGGLGLVLPGLTRIRPRLTSLAAACLFVLTLCAATYQLIAGQPTNAAFAVAIGLIAAGVTYSRSRTLPRESVWRSSVA